MSDDLEKRIERLERLMWTAGINDLEVGQAIAILKFQVAQNSKAFEAFKAQTVTDVTVKRGNA